MEKKHCFFLLIRWKLFYVLTKCLRTHGSRFTLCRWDESTSSYFSDERVMLRSSDIQTFFLTLRWTAFVNYTVSSNVDASTRLQTRRSSCQILSSNWICAGMLIYYGKFPWNINSDLGNRFRLFSGDKLQTFFISWDLSDPKWTARWHISDWSDMSHIWDIPFDFPRRGVKKMISDLMKHTKKGEIRAEWMPPI